MMKQNLIHQNRTKQTKSRKRVHEKTLETDRNAETTWESHKNTN